MSTYRIASKSGVVARIQTAPKKVFRVDGALRGPRGPIGPIGPNIDLRSDGTFVQWRVSGTLDWINLVNIAELAGQDGIDGREVELQSDGTNIQWRYTGDVAWTNLVSIASLRGADGTDGREVEFNNNGTYIRWRYVGDPTWINLVLLADISGTDGTNGTNGLNGSTILNGAGAPASGIGVNGDFYIDTSNKAIYGPKTSGAWGSATSLVGPAGSGTGDMLASMYDPTSKHADAFSMDNMVEGTTKKILSDTERAKLGGIATGATANATDAQLRDRSTHTGTQSADTIVDGTTNKVYTGTEQTKLAGIATGADVTGATNVAAAISGRASKATPVDADSLALIDSEASSVLKRLTWANVKSNLKSYFDGFYATITALGLKADDSAVVHNTGAETVAGIKTFSSSPVVPTPTTASQAATKAYVDGGFGSNSFVMSPVAVTGTKNGSNMAFTAPEAYVAGTLSLIINGSVQANGVDFTETTPSAGTFSIVGYAPVSTDDLRVTYQKSVNAVAGNADTIDGFHANATPTANQLVPLGSNAKFSPAIIDAPYNEVTLATTYQLPSATASGTYLDTGLTITLPAAGTYEISGEFRGDFNPTTTTSTWISWKLYDSTNGQYVPRAKRIGPLGNSAMPMPITGTTPMIVQYTVTGPATISVRLARNNGASNVVSMIGSTADDFGQNVLRYKRIA